MFFFSFSRALLLVIDTNTTDFKHCLDRIHVCLTWFYLFSLDCPVAALWLCACICDVALRQGCYWRLADVEMQLWAHVRVCGGFYCSLSCVVDTHTVIQPWVSRQTQTPTVGWDRPRVSFATQLYLLANPDLEMAIARFKTCGTIPSITEGSETLSLSCRFELPDIENGMGITHTASLLLQDIIMLSLKHYAQDVHPDLKPQRWGEVAQMAAVWEHAQSTVWIRNRHGFTQSSLTVCESNDKLKTSLALHHSESELKSIGCWETPQLFSFMV